MRLFCQVWPDDAGGLENLFRPGRDGGVMSTGGQITDFRKGDKATAANP